MNASETPLAAATAAPATPMTFIVVGPASTSLPLDQIKTATPYPTAHAGGTVNMQNAESGVSLHVGERFLLDLGERGWMVRRINNEQDIFVYLTEIKIDFLIQELVDLPLEFGVFYVRFPNEEHGFVNSITGKEFLCVIGDGKKALRELILENDRARLQWRSLQKEYGDELDQIIPNGKKMELVSIGNHCLGTKFLNGNHLITEKLSASFDQISKQLPGFYFGRYDLRCASIQDLENGKVKIVELNGCGAEPAHIYHPNASLVEGMRDLISHWQNLYRISRENHERGVAYISFSEGRSVYKRFSALRA